MSLVTGIALIAASLLLVRALKLWYHDYGPVPNGADQVINILLLPAISAVLMTGVGMAGVSVWSGTSLPDAGAAVLTAAVSLLAWRRFGAWFGRGDVLRLTMDGAAYLFPVETLGSSTTSSVVRAQAQALLALGPASVWLGGCGGRTVKPGESSSTQTARADQASGRVTCWKELI